MKRIIALILSLMLVSALVVPNFAAEKKLPFEPGESGTFFAPTFGSFYQGYNSLAAKYYLDGDKLEDLGAKALAKEAATVLNSMPEGRRIIQLEPALAAQMNKNNECYGFLLKKESVEAVAGRINEFFKALKELKVQVDIVFDDMESYPTVYGLENAAISNFMKPGEDIVTSYKNNGHLYEDWIKDKLILLEKEPRYKNELRPALEEAGYVFSENYELEYINIFPGAIEPRKTRFYESNPPEGAERAYIVFGNVIRQLAQKEYNYITYEQIKKYYPDVKYSNWRDHGISGQLNVYDFNGNLNYAKDDAYVSNIVGTHANWVFYGCYQGWGGWLEDNPPKEWRYDKFELFKNGFNQLKVDYIELAEASITNDGVVTVWISNMSYSYGNTPYYTEAMLHAGLFNPDPFLFFEGKSTDLSENLYHLDDIFAQLDELVGHDDRKNLITEGKNVSQWDDRYILTGMYAGGKNVWRITPDLYTAGATMDNFLVKENPPTFRIGNQNVEFPAGSYIYKPENDISEYGYWVISPEGSGYPREWRDSKHPMPGPQVPGGTDASPLGYTQKAYTEMPDEIDLSRSKEYKAPVADTKPDLEGGAENENKPVEDIVTKTLNLNPIRGNGAETEVFLGKLPADALNHWAVDILAHMLSLGIMQGSDAGMEPDKHITRAEFLAMLERVLGAETIEFSGDIADVKAEDWYATVMQTAASGGWIDLDVVTGMAKPNAFITRAEMCEIIVRALNLTENATADFTDNASMLGRVKADVAKVANAGLILGYQDGSFRPSGVLTRAETACVFERLIKQIPKLIPEE